MRSATTIWPGTAAASNRAATFTASPVTIASPGAGSSVASTSPVLIPIRICSSTPSAVRRPSLTARSRVEHPPAGAQGACGVVLVCGRHPERRHHGVADELLDRPALGLDLLAHRLRVGLHHLAEPFGIEALAELGRPGDVGEHDRDEPPLLPGASGGRHRLPARGAEGRIGRQRRAARGARRGELGTTVRAEPRTVGCRCAAGWAGRHGSSLWRGAMRGGRRRPGRALDAVPVTVHA